MTRADFYILHPNKHLEFLGSTSNCYSGDFENAKTEPEYRLRVLKLLKENKNIPAKWIWPWKHSKITDEVFIFKVLPKWYDRLRGSVYGKINHGDHDDDSRVLAYINLRYKYNMKFMIDPENAVHKEKYVHYVELPIMKN